MRRIFSFVVELIKKFNREISGPLVLDGRHLMGGHNNQPTVVDGGGGGVERRRDRGGTCGGVLYLRIRWGIEEE